MTLMLEWVACNLCGQNDYEVLLIRKDLTLFVPGDFRVVKCKNCGMVYLNPRPSKESFAFIYPEQYDQYTQALSRESSWLNRMDRGYGLTKRARAIINYKSEGCLLDIGCATGDFIELMQDHYGWRVYGVEPSISASDYAHRLLGLEVTAGTVETIGYEKGSFDVVTMWNVIEHLPDPLGTLKYIRTLLKPDGLLVFNTPNLDSLDAHLFGPYWIGFEMPRHFYVFSRHTLQCMLTRAGFRIIETRCLYGSHAAFMSSLRFWLRAQKMPASLRGLLETCIFSRLVRALMLPLFYISDSQRASTAPTDFCVPS